MVPLFFLACQPVVVEHAHQIPERLFFWDCPSESKLEHSDIGQSCRNNIGQREGPQLSRVEEKTIFSLYNNDRLVDLPWVVDSEGNVMESDTYNFIVDADSIPLLATYIRRFPNSTNRINVLVRLAALGGISADALFVKGDHPKHCRFVPEGMRCIRADSVVVALRDVGQEQPHFRAYQHPTYAIHQQPLGWDELIACQEECVCDASLEFWAQAEQYCTNQGLYLPAEWQYWAALEQIDFQSTELTRERWMPSNPREIKIQPMEYLHDPEYSSLPLQISPTEMVRGGEDTNLKFRCSGTIPQLQLKWEREQGQYPILLETLPPMPRVKEGGASDSWWPRDSLYRKYFDQGPRIVDEQVVQDYVYQDYNSLAELLWAYHLQRPNITSVYLLGQSHQGRPLLALRISDTPKEIMPKPSVLLQGGLHGNELLSTSYALDVLHYVVSRYDFDPNVQLWVQKLDIWIVPMLNPDGNWRFLRHNQGWTRGRKNGRNTDGKCTVDKSEGVDLSRNFPFYWGEGGGASSDSHPRLPYYRGESPGSEPETQAIMQLSDLIRFSAAISYHTPGTSVLAPYLHVKLNSPEPHRALDVASDLIKDTTIQSNGLRFSVKSGKSKMAGNDLDWMYHQYGTLGFMVEGSHHNPEKVRFRMESIEGVRPISIGLLNRIAEGPAVHGQVVDEAGNPIWATLYESNIDYFEKEAWTTRPVDGYFYRLVPEFSELKLHLNAPESNLNESVQVGRKLKLLHWEVGATVAHP